METLAVAVLVVLVVLVAPTSAKLASSPPPMPLPPRVVATTGWIDSSDSSIGTVKLHARTHGVGWNVNSSRPDLLDLITTWERNGVRGTSMVAVRGVRGTGTGHGVDRSSQKTKSSIKKHAVDHAESRKGREESAATPTTQTLILPMEDPAMGVSTAIGSCLAGAGVPM